MGYNAAARQRLRPKTASKDGSSWQIAEGISGLWPNSAWRSGHSGYVLARRKQGGTGTTRTTHPVSGMVRRFAREGPAMASSTVTSSPSPRPPRPNLAFRRLRGQRSPAEFAAAVRRAAREIGERVSCDARYIGRVEAGEIRCPNYAYERVFLHMFPGQTLADLGFAPRSSVRGRAARTPEDDAPPAHTTSPERAPSETRSASHPYHAHEAREPRDTAAPPAGQDRKDQQDRENREVRTGRR
ncbi:conserved hypothetical protein, partial [Streptomyces sp. e14]